MASAQRECRIVLYVIVGDMFEVWDRIAQFHNSPLYPVTILAYK